MIQERETRKLFFLIYQVLDDDGFEKISSITSANQTWQKLQTSYKREEKVKKMCIQTLRGEFELSHTKEVESISDYFSRFLAVLDQVKRNGVEDLKIIENIFCSLSPTQAYSCDN